MPRTYLGLDREKNWQTFKAIKKNADDIIDSLEIAQISMNRLIHNIKQKVLTQSIKGWAKQIKKVWKPKLEILIKEINIGRLDKSTTQR